MKHPGFKGAAAQIAAKEHLPMSAANRILGYGKAHASAEAKRKNPRLKRTGHSK